jgi:hypothetical protein
MRIQVAAVVFVVTAAIVACRGESPAPRAVLDPSDGTIRVSGIHKPFEVHSGAVTEPPMLGTYEVRGDVVIFHPRFPLVRGLRYTVRFEADGKLHDIAVMLPKTTSTPTTVVSQVYPTGDALPANQLKFYLYFSAPMSFGDAYRHIRLLDEDGREVQRAFLQTAHELWDADRQRFTLILDPGRIKRGLRSNVEDGAPLRAGRRYRLVIDADWRDGEGLVLREPFEKSFRVVDADRVAPDSRAWRLTAPAADTTDPVQLTMNEPLDRALLEEMIVVLDAGGRRVEGGIEIGAGETEWRFRPRVGWGEGPYVVHVSAKIEDRAGNNLQRLFDDEVGRVGNAPSSIELAFSPERRRPAG